MKKILFSDIDGTILENDLPISKKDQDAIHRLRQAGHYFSFCTGRNLQETMNVVPYFEYDYMVLNNGAMIVDASNQVVFRKQIKNQDAKEIFHRAFEKYPYLYYTFYDGYSTYGYFGQGNTCIMKDGIYQKIDEDFVELFDRMEDDFDIFCAYHPDGKLDEIKDIQDDISKHYPGVQGTLNVIYLDITVDHCSKGTGIETLVGLLDEEVESYCIGDSFNDLSMFKTANYPYTFNRCPEVVKENTKKQVDYVYELVDDMLGD